MAKKLKELLTTLTESIDDAIDNIVLVKSNREIDNATGEQLEQIQILTIMYTQVKFFIQLKLLKDKNKSDQEINAVLKTSPYRIKLSTDVVRKTTLQNLINIHQKIAKYDYLIKSGKTQEKEVIINFLLP